VSEAAEHPKADRAYWTGVYGTHGKGMHAVAVRLLGRHNNHLGHTAESVVREVMHRLMDKGDVLTASNIEAYLVAAVKNLATDILRQENRRDRDRLSIGEDIDVIQEFPSDEDVAEAATDIVIREKTQQLLAGMDEQHRQVFIDRVQRGRPFTEIGAEMGVSDSYAGRLFREALTEIRTRLGIAIATDHD
jgi:RNA polymerase sigma factor (sigma-70 family)